MKFNKHGGHRDGRATNCRECVNKHVREKTIRKRGGNPSIQKVCQTCRILKPLIDFYRKTNSPQGVQGACKKCQKERTAKLRLKSPKPKKIVAPVDPEVVIDLPGIFEIQNRGRNYVSYNFTSPVDDSTFSFPSFVEARKARKSMMTAFRQQAVFESVHRQSTGRPAANDGNEDL